MNETSLWDLDTPALIIDGQRLERNLLDVQERAHRVGKALRPHAKSHKMAPIAHRQLDLGAVGITTAKLAEAEAFADAGVMDLLVCYPIVGPPKVARLLAISRRCHVMSVVDSLAAARKLSDAFLTENRTHDVLVKVDAGFGRVGVPWEMAPELCVEVSKLPGLRLRGVCIHEGSTYREPDVEKRAAMSVEQCERLVRVAEEVRDRGVTVEIVSAGSTPGLAGALSVDGITEVRPGNYVFYDAMQVGLAVAPLEQCALTVLTRVVSTARQGGAICDAGSKVLSLDKGAHGLETTSGHGVVVNYDGLNIETLSEEHGWIRFVPEVSHPDLAECLLRVVPNHACPVVNNFREVWVVEGDRVVDRWNVCARGAVT